MLQGFLLTEELDLTTFIGLVKELVIDPHRSNYNSLLHIPFARLHQEPDNDASLNTRVVSRHLHLNYEEEQGKFDQVVAWVASKVYRL